MPPVGRMQPRHNAVRRNAAPLACGGALCRGLLGLVIGAGALAAAASPPQPAPAPGGAVVLSGGRLVDGTGRPPLERAALLIRDGRIRAVGPAADVLLPDDATRVDVAGKTIIPGRGSEQAAAARTVLAQARRNLKRLADGGVTIAMGTDSGTQLGRWQGYFEHVELELMVGAGLTPMKALVAATGNAARVMGLDELGTLEPGNRADFLVLDADPLADIRNTRRIDSIWIAGRRLAD